MNSNLIKGKSQHSASLSVELKATNSLKLSQKDLQNKSIVDKILTKLLTKKHLPIACYIFLEIKKNNYDYVLFSSLANKIIDEYKKNNQKFIKYGRFNNFYENDEQVKKAINITVTTTSAFHKVNKDKDNYMLRLNYSKALSYLKNVKNKDINMTVMQIIRSSNIDKDEKDKDNEEKSEQDNDMDDFNENDIYSEGRRMETENNFENLPNDENYDYEKNNNESNNIKKKEDKEDIKEKEEKNKEKEEGKNKDEEIKNIIEKNKINIKIIDTSKTVKDDKINSQEKPKEVNENNKGIIKIEPTKKVENNHKPEPNQIQPDNQNNKLVQNKTEISNKQNNINNENKVNNVPIFNQDKTKEKEKESTAMDFQNEDEEMNFIENCFNLDEKARQKEMKKTEPDINIEIPNNLAENLNSEEIKKRKIQKYIYSLNSIVKDKKSAIYIPDRVNLIKAKINKFNKLMSTMENDFKELSDCISLKEKENNENTENTELIQDKYDKLSKEIKENENYLNICYSNMQLIYKILMNSSDYVENFNENFVEKHQKLLKDYEKKYAEFLQIICDDFDKMKNLSKTKELRKIYQDIYEINKELNQNNFNYKILKNLEKKIDENVNEDKKVDTNIELFKNSYLQKKTKLMDTIESFLNGKKEKSDEKENTTNLNKEEKNKEETNKENKQVIANEIKV